MTLSDSNYATKSKSELIEEITQLNKELRGKNEEIAILKKRLVLYSNL